MHEQVVQIVLLGRHVLAGGEATKTFLIDVNSERIDSAEQHVNSEVKFQIVYQEWLVQIPLHHVVLILIEVIDGARQIDAFSLAGGFGFRDKGFASNLLFLTVQGLFELLTEITILCRQEPSLGEKMVIFGKVFLHAA